MQTRRGRADHHDLAGEFILRALRLFGRRGWIASLPLAGGWTAYRDLPRPSGQTFMEQYRAGQAGRAGQTGREARK